MVSKSVVSQHPGAGAVGWLQAVIGEESNKCNMQGFTEQELHPDPKFVPRHIGKIQQFPIQVNETKSMGVYRYICMY